jgi:hypothetical protein
VRARDVAINWDGTHELATGDYTVVLTAGGETLKDRSLWGYGRTLSMRVVIKDDRPAVE